MPPAQLATANPMVKIFMSTYQKVMEEAASKKDEGRGTPKNASPLLVATNQAAVDGQCPR